MNRPVAHYRPSRRYILFALLAIAGTVLCAWTGLRWPSTWIAAGLFGVTAAALIALLSQPQIEIYETHLQLGRRIIPWRDIRRLDQTGWIAPLAVTLTLSNDRRVFLVYAGTLDSSTSLLRHLRRYPRQALLDGIPYRQAWGELDKAPELGKAEDLQKQLEQIASGKTADPKMAREPERRTPPRPLLLPKEEEEIERMFQRLKSVGRLDQRDQRDQRDQHGSDDQ